MNRQKLIFPEQETLPQSHLDASYEEIEKIVTGDRAFDFSNSDLHHEPVEEARKLARLLLWLASLNQGIFSDAQGLIAVHSGGALMLAYTRQSVFAIEDDDPPLELELPGEFQFCSRKSVFMHSVSGDQEEVDVPLLEFLSGEEPVSDYP